MKLHLHRIYKGVDYTIGKLYVDGKFFCNTLEDTDRGLTKDMSIEEIKKIKVYGRTAIPTGKYKVTLEVQSPKFSNYRQYKFCDGYLPRLVNVPGFDGILIHIGNTDEDSSGCILVGKNSSKGKVLNSTATFKRLYDLLVNVESEISIDID